MIGGVGGWAPILTVKRWSRYPAHISKSSIREFALVTGSLPYLPANSVTALRARPIMSAVALILEDSRALKTLGVITAARTAMIASKPIISIRLKPE